MPNLPVPRHLLRFVFELRPLPSTGITRLPAVLRASPPPQRARPVPHGGVRLFIPDHASGFPVLRALSLVYMLPPLPRCSRWSALVARKITQSVSAFPGSTCGSACTSTVSWFARRSLALRPAHSRSHSTSRDRYPGASRHFVASMPAPVASGWSGRRAGLAPAGKRRLITAHAETGQLPELKRVIAAYGDRVVMEETLPAALAALFGQTVPAPPLLGPAGALSAGPVDARAREALGHYDRAIDRLKAGDWAGFGAELDALRPLLDQLSRQPATR